MKADKPVTLGLGPSCTMTVSSGAAARLKGVLAEVGAEPCGLEPLTAWPWGIGPIRLTKDIPSSVTMRRYPCGFCQDANSQLLREVCQR